MQDKGNQIQKFKFRYLEKYYNKYNYSKKVLLINKKIFLKWSNNILKKNLDDEIINFDQLNINLDNVNTSTIKKPKIQETSTIKNLLNCLTNVNLSNLQIVLLKKK